MALTAAQKKKFFRIRKEQGPEAAEAFRTQVTGGAEVTPGAPAGSPPVVDLNNPQSVLNYQGQINDRTVTQSTPNVTNDFGSRTITTDPVTGQKTVTEGLTGANKALMEQGQANQSMINSEFAKQMGFAAEQGKFDPRKGQTEQKAFDPTSMGKLPEYQDPRAGIQGVQLSGDARQGLRNVVLSSDARQGLKALPSWEDPRKTQIQAPGSFRDMQQQVYQNALQDYTSSVREDQSFRRDALEQQMANEGIPRDSVKYQRAMAQFEKTANEGINAATRAAYRDSQDVGSQAFQNQLAGQGQEFTQNFQTGDQRFNQSYNARGQQFGENMAVGNQQFDQTRSVRNDQFNENIGAGNQMFGQQMGLRGQQFTENRATGQDQFDRAYNTRAQDAGFQAQQFGQQSGLNDRAERMTQSEYMMPHQIAGQYMGTQGRFENPNMGPTQSINTPQIDALGYSTNYLNRSQQGDQFGATMDFNRWKAQGDWNTSRSNAASSGNPLANQKEMARYQDELARNRWWEQQGATANQGPQQPTTNEVVGNAVGGFATGLGQGLVNNVRR